MPAKSKQETVDVVVTLTQTEFDYVVSRIEEEKLQDSNEYFRNLLLLDQESEVVIQKDKGIFQNFLIWLDNNCHNDLAYSLRELAKTFQAGRNMPPASGSTLAQKKEQEKDGRLQTQIKA